MVDFFLTDLATESVNSSIDQKPLLLNYILTIIVEADKNCARLTILSAIFLFHVLVILFESQTV